MPGAGKVIVSGDAKFKVNGNTIQIKNVDTYAAGDIVVTCDAAGNVELDISELIAEADNVLKVISTGGANKIIPPTAETYIKIGSSTYEYAAVAGVEGERAYFITDGTTATAFVLANTGDSITVKDSSFKVYDDDEVLAGSEIITGSGFTVTKTRYGYVADVTAASASLSIGETEFAFSISKETRASNAFTNAGGIQIYFDEDGNIEGVQNLDLLTDAKDAMTVKAPNLIEEEGGGIPLIASGAVVPASGLITTALINGYISVSDGGFTFAITNDDDSVVIAGVKGSYKIINYGSNVTINAGDGNDTIYNGGSNVSINGGAGNDAIETNGENVSIDAGAGNDYIDSSYGNGSNILFTYTEGDGNDLIRGFRDNSTLQIGGGDGSYSMQASGSDIIVTVGEGSITLEGAANLESVNIAGVESVLPVNSIDSSETYTEIDGTEGNDFIRYRGTLYSQYYGSYVTINAGAGNDTIYTVADWYDDYDEYGGGTDYAGRVYPSDMEINAGDDDDYISNVGKRVTINGGTGNDTIVNSGSDVTITGGAGNDTIKLTDTISDKSQVIYYNEGDGFDVIQGFGSSDKLVIGDGSGTYSTQTSGSDVIVTSGEGNITLRNIFATSKDLELQINDEIIYLDKQEVIELSEDGDYIANQQSSIKIVGNKGDDTIYNSGSNVTILSGSSDNYISNTGSNVIIEAGAGDDSINNYNGRDNVTITAGAGDDTISNGSRNASINAGSGNDYIRNMLFNALFTYNEGDGNDTIWGFSETSTLQIGGGTGSYSTQQSGEDIIVTVGEGSITLEGAATKKSVNINGKNIFTLELDNSSPAKFTLDTEKDADASARTKAIQITGNEWNNIIRGGKKGDTIFGAGGNDKIYGRGGNDVLYGDEGNDSLFGGSGDDTISGGEGNDSLDGGTGNDSLWGGTGNDSLWGDAGKDMFIYTANEGTDRIYDFETGDLLKILNVDGSDGSFKSSKYSGGDLTLTINGGGKIILYDVSTSDTFNINGTSYKISGNKLK